MPSPQRPPEVTHPERVLFPESGITKGDLVDYYRRIADRMLPHVEGRPLVLNRYPEGIEEAGFIQQHLSASAPDWLGRVTVEKEGGTVTHAVADSAAALVYLANQSVVTLHVWLSRMDRLHHPDRMIFDLDPPGEDFEPVRRAARAVRSLLDEVGLPAFLMTTGSSGLHVVTPLDRRADFDTVRAFARDAADVLAARFPDLLTAEQRKAKREGRVFLDTLRNTYAHTAVAPYAVRALPGAPVATPLAWDELARPDLDARRYTVRNVFRRLARKADPWATMEKEATGLEEARRLLDQLR
ncbi:MAG TPA: non-homologous end-joining DNA ligase [Rhodothermales bacterium]|nr:non-homologous end-joining DNA ligase [Rhodothermales bacterium]